MIRSALVFMSFIFIFFNASVIAGELINGSEAGSIILRDSGGEKVYKNITGTEYEVDRSLVEINGSPGLLVLSKDTFYFTLLTKDHSVIIDCAYSDKRNNYNGARMTAGMCGLNTMLDENYIEIAESNSNKWWSSIYSFDTRPVFKDGLATNFLLGSIGNIEIYDRYESRESLINAAPRKYVKGPLGCYDFGSSVVFFVFSKEDGSKPKYLDLLQSEEPIRLQRLKEKDLEGLAIKKCAQGEL